MKNLFIILTLLLTSGVTSGETKKEMAIEKKVVKAKNIKKIKVHGMACPMCQSKAEKKFKEVSEVNGIDVDMEKMLITLNLKEGKDLSVKKIKPIIESLGLNFVEIVK